VNPSLSIVIPVYQSEKNLPSLVEALQAQLTQMDALFEVILVNDGSRDSSWNVIELLCRKYPWVRASNLLRNYGQHNALLCGIRMARYDIIVTMDDDHQHPPNMIPKLVQEILNGMDVVYGVPQKKEHGFWRNLVTALAKLALRFAAGISMAGDVSAFQAFRTPLRSAFENYSGAFVSIDVLLAWGARHYKTIPVVHHARKEGASNYTLRRLIKHFVNMVTGFSIWPLRFVSLIGFFCTLLGFSVLATAIYLSVVQQSGNFAWFIAAMISLFAGAQLFALGIIGEYLACIHFRNMGKPAYVVAQKLNDD